MVIPNASSTSISTSIGISILPCKVNSLILLGLSSFFFEAPTAFDTVPGVPDVPGFAALLTGRGFPAGGTGRVPPRGLCCILARLREFTLVI